MTPVTHELLTRLEPADVLFDGVPEESGAQTSVAPRFRIGCPACRHNRIVAAKYLGQTAKCKQCAQKFPLDWGEPTVGDEDDESGATE